MEPIAPQTVSWDLCSTRVPGALDQYRESFAGICDVAGTMDAYGSPFRSQNQTTIFAGGFVSRARSSSQALIRSPDLARRRAIDEVGLLLVRSEMKGQVGDRDYAVGSRGVVLHDFAAAGRMQWEDLDLVLAVRPRDRIPPRLLEAGGLGGLTENEPGLVRLIGDQLESLSHHAATMSHQAADLALDAVFLLADRAVGGRGPVEPDHRGALYVGVRHRARTFIRRHLGTGDLTVDRVAKACAVSRATLFRAFDGEGGVQHVIQGMRLDQARKALTARHVSRQSIAAIAYAHGFSCPAYFSRAFRARFGCAPSDVAVGVGDRDATAGSGPIRHAFIFDWLRAAA